MGVGSRPVIDWTFLSLIELVTPAIAINLTVIDKRHIAAMHEHVIYQQIQKIAVIMIGHVGQTITFLFVKSIIVQPIAHS